VSAVEERSYVEAARREKRAALEARGVPAFAYRFERSHPVAEARGLYRDEMGDQGPVVSLGGRIASLRIQGKTSFVDLEDGSGRIQLYLRRDELGAHYDLLDHLDLDDYVGVRGRLFRTRRGELSVRPDEITLLAKSLRPLPRGKTQASGEGAVTFGGLADPEVRYRQRYADLAVHPEVREVFRLRARAITWIRRFLDERDFLEVETPILQPLYGGAAARPFVTHHNALDMPLYLRIADELYLKRLLVGGLERVYEIGHDFRNEGMDRIHNPEFTMLEVYQAYADYTDMMEGVRERCGLDLRTASEEEMRRVLTQAGEPADAVRELGGGKLQDEVFKVTLEPHLVQPTFVLDYPKPLSPLAKEHRSDPALTERFELFVGGRELANAFSELNDPDDQRRRFEDQVRQRAAGNEEAHAYDADYIRALEYGMPPAGGMGLGVDRLMMVIADQPSIRDVILYPAMRPEEG
jgi:lysyl-tRNA synthetase class 2